MLKKELLLSEMSDAHQDTGSSGEHKDFCQRAEGMNILI